LPERKEVTGDWRRLHNEELHDLYSLPDIIGVIKGRRMRGVGACMWERSTYGVLLWQFEEEDHMEDVGNNEGVILKCLIKK
jgi:hypothetical protein